MRRSDARHQSAGSRRAPDVLIKKDIFRAGRYRLNDGSTHVFTRQDVIDAYHNTRAMLRAGHAWTPPIIWEHSENEGPVPLSAIQHELTIDRNRRAEMMRNTLGYPTDVKLEYEKGVPVLYAECQVPDRADAEQWRRVGRCSACIKWDMKDSAGRFFPGATIFHIAATTRPIQHDQKTVSLSSLSHSANWTAAKTMFLAESDMADENTTPGGKSDDLTQTKQLVGQLGYPVPDEVTDLATLNIALKAHVLAKTGDTSAELGDDDGDEPPPPDDNDPNVNPGGDGATTGQGFGGGTMLSDVAAGQRVLDAATRRGFLDRLDRVEGFAASKGLRTAVELRKIRDALSTVSLSWGGDGLPKMNKAIQALVDVERSVQALRAAGVNDGKGKGKGRGFPRRETESLSAIAGRTEQELAKAHADAELRARGFLPAAAEPKK